MEAIKQPTVVVCIIKSLPVGAFQLSPAAAVGVTDNIARQSPRQSSWIEMAASVVRTAYPIQRKVSLPCACVADISYGTRRFSLPLYRFFAKRQYKILKYRAILNLTNQT
jgi:hypothetical protein